jgi:hypothetical protein
MNLDLHTLGKQGRRRALIRIAIVLAIVIGLIIVSNSKQNSHEKQTALALLWLEQGNSEDAMALLLQAFLDRRP